MQAIRSYLSLVLIAIVSNTFAQAIPIRKTNFDNDWKFAFGNASDPTKDFNYSLATIFSKSGNAPGTPANVPFNDTPWRKLNLPHDWVVELPFVNAHPVAMLQAMVINREVGGLFPETSID